MALESMPCCPCALLLCPDGWVGLLCVVVALFSVCPANLLRQSIPSSLLPCCHSPYHLTCNPAATDRSMPSAQLPCCHSPYYLPCYPAATVHKVCPATLLPQSMSYALLPQSISSALIPCCHTSMPYALIPCCYSRCRMR